MKLRGRKLSCMRESLAAFPGIPMLQPAYLLRRPEDNSKAWDDLHAIAKICDELGIRRGPDL